jgi:hypothetical protein
MKKRSAIFAAVFIILVLFGASCDSAERDTVAEPSPTVTPTIPPKTDSLSSTTTPSPPAPSAPAPSAPPWMAAGATNRVADITGTPNAFIGKTVTVVAEVDNIHTPRAFTLDGGEDDSALGKGAGEDLLTLVPKVGGFPSVDAQWKDDKARVTGVVQRMMVKDVEREIGWELPANLKSGFKGRPVLIARSIERLVE